MENILVRGLVVSVVIAIGSSQDFDPTVCMELSDGSKIPSPFLCNQFYVCESGMLSEEGTCPQNMLFNPESQDCDFPQNVDCKGVPLPPGYETEEQTTQSTETDEPVTSSTRCPPEDPEDPIFLPVENDCSSYILCFHGKEILRTCPGDLKWNRLTFECDSSSADQCKKPDEFGCPSEGIDFIPHPDTCKKYVYCRDGYSRVQSCAFFKVFDEELKTCVLGGFCG